VFHKFLLIIGILLVSLSALTAQDEVAGENNCPPDFEGHLAPRLTVGEIARTRLGIPLNIRPQPTTGLARLGVMPSAVNFEVLDGPLCGDGYIWWRGEYMGVVGWLAEGNPNDEEYWLEPRGELVVIEDEDGIERRYVLYGDDFLEPEGCMEPPEDYTIEQLGYARLNRRTLAMIQNAQRIYEAHGGSAVNFRQAITQGSYNPGGVDASFGTHDGGGAVDFSVRSPLDWSVLTEEIEPMVEALRVAGFAAWLRDTGELYPNSPIHIHAVAIGDAELSPAARAQIDGERGYLLGHTGLPAAMYDGPQLDRHGGPVICRWMEAAGFGNLRDETATAIQPGITATP
jgi:hypothetical protein